MTGVWERLLLAAIVLAVSTLVVRLLHGRTKRLAAASVATAPAPSAAVLAFHARWCGACSSQRAQLDALADVAVQYVDVEQDRDETRRYGVRSLPTTIVIGADGAVAAVNHGLVTAATLRSQLVDADGPRSHRR